jgi:hypothetical protein
VVRTRRSGVRKPPYRYVHATFQVSIISGRSNGPIFVIVEAIDHVLPASESPVTWHRLDELLEGGHVISRIGQLIKPALIETLKRAGVTIA